MEKEIGKIVSFCKRNKIEINVDADGVSLWADIDGSNFTISEIKPENVGTAVDAVLLFRKRGWKTV